MNEVLKRIQTYKQNLHLAKVGNLSYAVIFIESAIGFLESRRFFTDDEEKEMKNKLRNLEQIDRVKLSAELSENNFIRKLYRARGDKRHGKRL